MYFWVGRVLVRVFKIIGIKEQLLESLILKFKKIPKMDSNSRSILRNFYKEDIKQLEQLINRNLDFWK